MGTLAALMAPEDHQSAHLQRLEDSCLRRMWRLINAFGKVRQGILQKKDVKIITFKAGMCMKTNKTLDKMPGKKSDIYG